MKKIILIFGFVFIYATGFCLPSDSLYLSSKEYQTLNDKIIQIEKQNAELSKSIEAVNIRISDWYTNLAIGGSLFIVLLAGLFAVQWSNTKGIAKEQAEKELKELEDKYATLDEFAKSLELRYKKHENYLKTTGD